jgi:hypothetical protein
MSRKGRQLSEENSNQNAAAQKELERREILVDESAELKRQWAEAKSGKAGTQKGTMSDMDRWKLATEMLDAPGESHEWDDFATKVLGERKRWMTLDAESEREADDCEDPNPGDYLRHVVKTKVESDDTSSLVGQPMAPMIPVDPVDGKMTFYRGTYQHGDGELHRRDDKNNRKGLAEKLLSVLESEYPSTKFELQRRAGTVSSKWFPLAKLVVRGPETSEILWSDDCVQARGIDKVSILNRLQKEIILPTLPAPSSFDFTCVNRTFQPMWNQRNSKGSASPMCETKLYDEAMHLPSSGGAIVPGGHAMPEAADGAQRKVWAIVGNMMGNASKLVNAPNF